MGKNAGLWGCGPEQWAEKWGAAVPLSVGGTGSPSDAMSPVYIVYQAMRRPNTVQSLVGLRWATSLQ